MKKKGAFLCIIFGLIGLILSGCWSRKELKDIGVVGFIAMDKGEESVDVTLEIITPKRIDSTSEEKAAKILECSGKTISSAISNVNTIYNNELILSHANVYICSEAIAQEGLMNYVEFLNRYYQGRRYVHLAVIKDSTMSEVTKIAEEMDEPISQHIESLFDNYTEEGKTASVKFIDFLQDYYQEGIEPVTGVIYSTETGGSEEGIGVEGLAVFKDDKLVGFLDGEGTRSYNIITNKLDSCILVTTPDNQFGQVAIEVLDSASSFGMQIKDGELLMSVSIAIKGMIDEAMDYSLITEDDVVNEITENLSELVATQVKEAIYQAQAYEADIFGFGQYIHRYHPKVWNEVENDWDDLFQSLNISIDVEVDIERAGVTNEPLDIQGN